MSSNEIVDSVRALGRLIKIREIVVKDGDELDRAWDELSKDACTMITKHTAPRKYHSPFLLNGINITDKTTRELRRENEDLQEKIEALRIGFYNLCKNVGFSETMIRSALKDYGI